ncbi:MAG: SHOCT domain-containing protein [Acidimicrobiia bacterium]
MTFLEIVLLLVIWVPLLLLWVFTLSDLARRVDLPGLAKGLWAVCIVLLPIIGMIVYFVARPNDAQYQKPPEQLMAEAMSDAGLGGSTVDQLETLSQLKDSGAITDEEFAKLKADLLS